MPPTSCARPTVRGTSTYTVLGFVGYAAGNLVAALLATAWGLTLGERLISFLLPPLSFLAVVYTARRIMRRERIVFYQTTLAGVVVVALAAAIVGGNVARCLDIVVVGYGVFLVFGRVGCFSVACCHGRPARFGVVYGHRHVNLGFWWRWSGRRLWPVQLLESAASLILVVAGLVVGWGAPGEPALIYCVGYGASRFAFEMVRGDSARPQLYGLSEAQWTATVTLIACAMIWPNSATIAPAVALALASLMLVVVRRRRELWLPPHLRAIDTSCARVLREPTAREETLLGVTISRHELPDGRTDWVFSSVHPAWSARAARRVAAALWLHARAGQGWVRSSLIAITETGAS